MFFSYLENKLTRKKEKINNLMEVCIINVSIPFITLDNE